MSQKQPIRGVFVPNIPPYDKAGRINHDELRRIVDWLIEKGVSGLYPNGSLGDHYLHWKAIHRRI